MRVLHRTQLVVAIATLLIISGGLYVGVPWMRATWQRHQGSEQNAATLQAATKKTVAVNSFTLQNPVQLALPRLGISLVIKQGVYNKSTQSWPLDRTSTFVMQPWQNQDGIQLPMTPVIYGHDIPAVFMHLNGVAPNELLIITQQNGTKYTLRYINDVVVSPYNNSVFAVRYPKSVLLMTCTGAHFESRRVLRFELVGQGSGA
ncbi:MAG TPA: sortase [Candidatus Saccharimonadales bacterium]|nr:sortase [Candidatus Saccharimonadales bacterium]